MKTDSVVSFIVMGFTPIFRNYKLNASEAFYDCRIGCNAIIAKNFLKIHTILVYTLTGLLFLGCSETNKKSQERPNVILIVADDLGYSDLGCYGGEIQTPALDDMAAQGIRLSNMHNAGMCVISRSSMLTGQWWPRVGFGIEQGTNLAQVLQQRGYRTGLVGKWHLQGEPNQKGFDYFFGFLGGYSSYFKGSPDYRLNSSKYDDFGNDFYSTDAFSERAIEFIEAETEATDEKDEKPFFLYLSYQAPHNPLQASKEDIMKYRGNYLKGWQAVRDARIEKQLQMGVIASETPLPEYPMNLPDWNSLSEPQKDLEDLRMSVYAAMVERMDTGIGRVMEALRASGLEENTLILFLSDNGTDSFSVMDSVMLDKGLLPGDIGSNYQPGTGWAFASVAPKRLYKISQHGGGVKTGAIAKWPKASEVGGAISKKPLHVVDIMPTVLELTDDGNDMERENSEIPTEKALSTAKFGTSVSKFAGKSFLPLLRGESWERNEPMFFQFMDNRAIRTEKFSLVEVDGSGWELYDNQNDPLETDDISEAKPEMVSELEKQWLSWWTAESGKAKYKPESTVESSHYKPQGDRGSGSIYSPSAMPDWLQGTY